MKKTVKVATLDTIFSLAVREQYDYICAYPHCPECGNHSLRENGGIECSHYHKRRYRSGRWHPDNCLALCHPIHQKIDNSPQHVHADLMKKILGGTRFEILTYRLMGTFRYRPQDRWEMTAHYRAQEKKMTRQRLDGQQGTLILTPWD